jgi:hypothetical protein
MGLWRPGFLVCVVVGTVMGGGGTAIGASIHGSIASSENGTGASYSGTINFFPDPLGRSAFLRVDLENTTPTGPSSIGGSLTAFAFNRPAGLIQSITFLSPYQDFDRFFYRDNALDAPPFGDDFDLGVGIDGDQQTFFTEAGDPEGGIRPGGSRLFAFRVVGFGLNRLSADDFLGAEGSGGNFFAARFRGLSGVGGPVDSVAAVIGPAPQPPPPEPVPIPEPGTLILFGGGLAGVLVRVASRSTRVRRSSGRGPRGLESRS